MQKRILALLSFGHMVTDINQGLLPIFLTILKEQMGLSYMAVGVVVMASNISSSVIQPLFGYWSDRTSNRWLLPAGVFLAGAGMALAGLAPNFWSLLLAVLISGLGIASYHPEASKTAHFASGRLQASSMAIFSVGGNLGFGLGPLIAGAILSYGGLKASPLLILPAALTALLLWLSLPAIARVIAAREAAEYTLTRQKEVKANAHLGGLVLLITIVILRSWLHAGLTNYIPLYYVNYLHGDPTFASTLLSIFLISGALGTLLGGRAADYWGPKKMILLSMAVMIPLVLIFPRAQGAWVVAVIAISGFFLISTFATTIVMAQALLPQYVGMASGLMIGFAIGTGGVGVTFLGAIADRWGVPFTLSLMAAIPVLALILALFLPDLRRTPAQSQ
ncbi:MAG: transporter, family, fosmidomycin resistance protein [Clostridia bacterium]|nr:transporter, family, fosmidomycin resistance protein [Clostridia bacterium]